MAELGDKTQLATMLFAAREGSRLAIVFMAASTALVATTAIGVVAGALVANYVDGKYLSYAAGAAFIVIGVWTIARA